MMAIKMKEAASGDSAPGWRCLLCGETVDPGIEANRTRHGEPTRSLARPPGSVPSRAGRARRGETSEPRQARSTAT